MCHMKQASIRDLRYRFPEIERMLRRGETIEITRRGKPIGCLAPARPEPAAVAMPDIMARLRRIHGNKVFKVSNAELIRRDRDGRW